LQNTIEDSVKSNEALANTIERQKLPEKIDGFEKRIKKKLELSFTELQKNTKQIATETAKSILDLNLSVRIDKLDANIAGIISAIQNVQGRIESVERNIIDKLKEANEKQAVSMSNFQEKVNQTLTTIHNDMLTQNINQEKKTYITWGLITLSSIIITLIIKYL